MAGRRRRLHPPEGQRHPSQDARVLRDLGARAALGWRLGIGEGKRDLQPLRPGSETAGAAARN
eukprot:943924-Amphidinium_carterae.1